LTSVLLWSARESLDDVASTGGFWLCTCDRSFSTECTRGRVIWILCLARRSHCCSSWMDLVVLLWLFGASVLEVTGEAGNRRYVVRNEVHYIKPAMENVFLFNCPDSENYRESPEQYRRTQFSIQSMRLRKVARQLAMWCQ